MNKSNLILLLFLSIGSMTQAMEQPGLALIRVASEGNLGEVQQLVAAGAGLNQKDSDGWTALMGASTFGFLEIVQCLIHAGADVNQRNTSGMTALMYAGREGYQDIMQCLLNAKADLSLKDKSGLTALMNTVEMHQKSCSELLIDHMLRLTEDQKKEVYVLLFCLKNLENNILSKDIQRLIAQHLCALHAFDNKIKVGKEINTIPNEEIKAELLAKYFPDKEIV